MGNPKSKYARSDIFQKGIKDTEEGARQTKKDIMDLFFKWFDQMQEMNDKGGDK